MARLRTLSAFFIRFNVFFLVQDPSQFPVKQPHSIEYTRLEQRKTITILILLNGMVHAHAMLRTQSWNSNKFNTCITNCKSTAQAHVLVYNIFTAKPIWERRSNTKFDILTLVNELNDNARSRESTCERVTYFLTSPNRDAAWSWRWPCARCYHRVDCAARRASGVATCTSARRSICDTGFDRCH